MSRAREQVSKSKEKDAISKEIERKDKAFVLFYASWCPFSQRFLPIFEEYSKNNPAECTSFIIDEEPEVCEKYAIEYYPTVIMFKKGKVHKRLDSRPGIGLNKKQLEELTEKQ